jgi:hypothetical protein
MATRGGGKAATVEPAADLAWESVLAWRVGRQGLARRAPRDEAVAMVARVCGLQAQVLSAAELALWARVEGLRSDDVARALWEERTLVKTWAMRGTLHLLPAAEFPLWVAARGVLKERFDDASWLRYHGLTREEAVVLYGAIPRALAGATLTREELAGAVVRLTGLTGLGEKLLDGFGALLKPAAARGDLCFAPSASQHVRFARPVDWLGAQGPVAPGDAIREVVRRYLAAYGPATREEFARWFGVPSPAGAGKLLQRIGDELVPVAIEGRLAWALAGDVAGIAAATPAGIVRLLPAFDPYTVAAPRDAPAVLPAAHKGRVYRPQGWLSPVLLIDGRMAGVWRHERQGDRLAVTIEPFAPLPAPVRDAAGEEAARLAAFLGGALALAWAS